MSERVIEMLLVALLGGALSAGGFLAKRRFQKDHANEALDRKQKVLTISDMLKNQGLGAADLESIEKGLLCPAGGTSAASSESKDVEQADRGRRMMGTMRRFITVAVTASAFVACGDQGSTRAPAPPTSFPDYKVVATRDVSMGAVRRLQVRVSLPDHYSRDVVEQVAQAVVADITKSQPVNAISILLYGPGTSTAGVYDVAMVEWAPNGQWGDAGSVRVGDYATFRYAVSYNPPAPSSTASSILTASQQKGLLGVPLPEGTQLTQRTPGDPSAGRDPSERYTVSASAGEIAVFFNQAMPSAGWAKDGTSTNTALFFRKGNLMIGVLIKSSGGTFTLMGS